MTDKANPSRRRETRATARPDRQEMPSGLLPAPQKPATRIPVKAKGIAVKAKGIQARPGRPVSTVRVSTLFL
ncbi:hypothetical protein [Streptomyces sp. NPDC051909]|uniref:hypothetical protein n=1 Tax=Streptomyces sp. NPDC051909 TaxID=3154944 RepID=UPI00343E3843